MADIKNFTDIILTQAEGEKVRDAFIDILKILNRMGGNTSSLNGRSVSYFASNSEMNDMYDLFKQRINWEEDGKPHDNKDPKTAHLLTSGQIWEAVNAVDNILADLNNYEVPLKDLVKDIEAIEKAKKKIMNAIKTKAPGKFTKKSGRDTNDFRKYEQYIRELNGRGNLELRESPTFDEKQNGKTVSADEEYEDTTQEDEHVYAWSKITTEVKFKTETKSTSYNEILNKSADSIGFTSITVNESNSIGYGRAGGANGVNSVDENGVMSSVTITENGPRSASEDGVEGWKTVVVNVENNDINFDATYTVNFFNSDGEGNKTDLIASVSGVPYNGTAVLPEDKSPVIPTGLYFAGWNPPSSKIRKDTDCVAVLTNDAPGEGEAPYSWEEIVAAAGTNCVPGQWKTLALTDNRYGPIRMQKVAVGENGSSSTWIAMDTLKLPKPFTGQWDTDGDDPSYRHSNQGTSDGEEPMTSSWRTFIGNYGWSMSNLRQWLNNEFYNTCLPEFLRDAIVEVPKLSFEFNWDYRAKFMSSVYDRIWIPSLTELFGDIENLNYRTLAMKHYETLADGITNTGHIGTGQGPSLANVMNYDQYTNEFKGMHYNLVYPSSSIEFNQGPNHDQTIRVPANTNGLLKCRASGNAFWFTRTVVNTEWQIINNYWGPMIAAINNSNYQNGAYTEASIGSVGSGGGSYSLAQVAIGFCL